MSCFPVILSSPSGGGKTTIARMLLTQRRDLGYSVSATTRHPREGEVDGVDYFFLTPDEFAGAVKRGDFAEWATVHGQKYGTLKREVERVLSSGKHVIMDIDVQGARLLSDAFANSVLIFLLPPSADVLVERLRGRRSEGPEALVRRLETAVQELKAVSMYHYMVTNDRLDIAVARVSSIIDAEAARRERRSPSAEVDVGALITQLQLEIRKQQEKG
ncbi:MAG TPA: guanylate kinase [Gemmatimonadaceae bacterium]|nr:guanylate kinase [Gemmatimonadaceae bacterium]